MQKNRLGNSELHVSELTLGCMSLGKDQKQAGNIIDYALEHNINHLDTADLYDFGKNEEVVGKAIKEKREQIILTSKVGNNFNKEDKNWYWDPSKKHITEGLKDSLKRLQTDYIDFYMLHGGTIEDPIDETIEAFEILKREGLIRAYGISSIRPNVIKEYVKHSNIDAVMMQYNILDRRPEEEILDLLHSNNISVLARGPLAKGMLSNHSANVIARKGKEGFLDYSFKELTDINKNLATLCDEDFTLNEMALKYTLKNPAIASAVFGASSVEQVKENIANYNKEPLSDELYSKIRQISKPIQYNAHR
ncbi:aldo/keto reductase [Virgibacillus halodenitrificans]|uniref:Aldo/keto reductase n=1 Tax=Virgibacillus halodenitrificans TaxID=1482 RepID=A0ABR7VPF3_VIRHA|nr:aldo/keto reductase [Virgibacillus halodenitrificans]MBD1222677.1 aldo/keto reductase [Virgibacillus halodenitrificans]MCG1029844.1 aldo/keto reductase [Virgibacillus halodenitrificans]MCJ0930940.1 aldo/keto reductase [Virgibacillus halodenitrificans]MYL46937.1 aldo/keto reductase [Virgibacillus halodenitrificans]CDQ35574.1 General stress protein 69 [Virgibacillus halodenitrificans]